MMLSYNVFYKYVSKKNTIKLFDLYCTLSQDAELEHMLHLKHRIRGSLFSLKKSGRIKRVSDATYKILD